MKTFEEWLIETHPEIDEGFGKVLGTLGLGAAIGAGALGLYGNKSQTKSVPNPTTIQQNQDQDQEYHWSPEIGKYQPEQGPNGEIIYKTNKGNFIRVHSKLDVSGTGHKFVKLK